MKFLFSLLCVALFVPDFLVAQPSLNYRIRTIAGSNRLVDQSPALETYLKRPQHVSYDKQGHLYVCDTENQVVRKVDRAGNSSVIAGTGYFGYSGDGGPAKSARLYWPGKAVADSKGNVYIHDAGNQVLRRVSADGVIVTYATTQNIDRDPEGGPVQQARFRSFLDLAIDPSDNVYVADGIANVIRRISPEGRVSTYAGLGTSGYAGDGAQAINASFNGPMVISFDASDGSLFVADRGNSVIRRIAADGIIRTVGRESNPISMAAYRGSLYVFSWDNQELYRLSSGGQITPIVKNPPTEINVGYRGDGGLAISALFDLARSIAVDPDGNVAIADEGNHRIRSIQMSSAQPRISTIVGRDGGTGDGALANLAKLNKPRSLALDSQGNLLFSDEFNYRIRRVNRNGTIQSIAGNGANSTQSFRRTDGLPAAGTGIDVVSAVAVAPNGNIMFFAGGGKLRSISSSGILNTLNAGVPNFQYAETVDVSSASFTGPVGMRFDLSGNLLVADSGNSRVRQLAANGRTVSLLAGANTNFFCCDGLPANSISLYYPVDAIPAPGGGFFIANTVGGTIIQVRADGLAFRYAGGGSVRPEFEGSARASSLGGISALRLDSYGHLFYTSQSGHRVFRISPDGSINLIAGNGTPGFSGDGGLATSAELYAPQGIEIDKDNNIYIADTGNDRIRILSPLFPGRLNLKSGAEQYAAPNMEFPAPLVLRVASSDDLPLRGVRVNFLVESGSAILANSSVTTQTDGSAVLIVRAGATIGPVKIRASVDGLAPLSLTLNVGTAPVVTTPLVAAGGVISASAFGGSAIISPGSWIEIYGSNFATTTREWRASDFNGNRAPVVLDGVRVSIAGRDAFVQRVSSNQLNVQVPDEILSPEANSQLVSVVVTNPNGSSNPISVMAAQQSPGLLTPWPASAAGTASALNYVYALLSDGQYAGPPGLVPGLLFRRVFPGETIVMYGIGFGAVSPERPAGTIADTLAPVARAPRIRIGGQDAHIGFAGLIPNAIGLYQINLVVPDAGRGNQNLLILDQQGQPYPQSYVLPMVQ